ncbi:hypothetical protein [Actinocrispum wychmicini]|nr:hypothetical protein [Actinocrispum wychmicini]
MDLFLLAHAHLAAGQDGNGAALERRIRAHLVSTRLPHTPGWRVFGHRSLSGLYHQIDEQTQCHQALVIGEWKAYTGRIPKNDLLRFKAVTDDYWLSSSTRRDVPIVRIFGGTGTITEQMRAYAAQAGIILITPDHWPIPALCDPDLLWCPGELDSPSPLDVRTMLTLTRSLGDLLQPQLDGSWRMPPFPTPSDLAPRFAVWRHWSERAWAWWDDAAPARFDWLMDTRTITTGATR